MGLLEKRIENRECDTPGCMWISEVYEVVEEMRTDIESNATFASKELMVIDRKKWLKWFGAEPLLTVDKVEEK